VTVLYCDAAINRVDTFTPEEFPVMLKPCGGGGTSFRPVIDWVLACGEEVECLVYLTDGYGDQSCIPEPAFPTVWLTTGSEDFDWGTIIKFEPEE
jgi:predicted metal-dependent peptidase